MTGIFTSNVTVWTTCCLLFEHDRGCFIRYPTIEKTVGKKGGVRYPNKTHPRIFDIQLNFSVDTKFHTNEKAKKFILLPKFPDFQTVVTLMIVFVHT